MTQQNALCANEMVDQDLFSERVSLIFCRDLDLLTQNSSPHSPPHDMWHSLTTPAPTCRAVGSGVSPFVEGCSAI